MKFLQQTLLLLLCVGAQDPASSYYRLVPCPHLNADGTYTPNPQGRPIRVYTRLDIRLMLADFEAKIKQQK